VLHSEDADEQVRHVESFVRLLRPGGLEEVLVWPFSADSMQRFPFSHHPEVVAAYAPAWPPRRVELDVVRERTRGGRVPTVLFETWAWAEHGSVRLASMPRGRDEGLDAYLEGVLVVGGEGGAPILEAAWDPEAPPVDEAARLLMPHVPIEPSTPSDLLLGASRSMSRMGVPEWRDLASDLATRGEAIRELPSQVVATATSPIVPDGRRSEPAWLHATRIELEGLPVWAISTGRELVLAADLDVGRRLRLAIDDEDGKRTEFFVRHVRESSLGWRPREPVFEARSGPRDGTQHVEIVLDRFALNGEAYPTRVFRVYTKSNTTPAVTLVIGR
jgi:hypothetical protein